MSEGTQSASAEQKDIKAMQELLGKAEEIYKKNDSLRAEKRRGGELFNVFNVLGLRSEEVRLHSAFLAELLDPNGLHGCADKFLAAFCKQTGVEFDSNGARVEKEKVFDDGRMDIVITQKDNKKVIVIENKIYAGDIPSQLQRYKKYCGRYGDGNWTLLYLTLDGHGPSDESVKLHRGEKPYWQDISYRNDIEAWLNECVHIAADKRRAAGSIEQYLDLVKQLTNNYLEDEMAEEVMTLLMEGKNLALADRMVQRIGDAKFKVWEEKIMPMLKERCKVNDFGFGDCFGEKWSYFAVHKTKWDEYHLYICFEFDKPRWRDFYSGITYENGKTPAKIVEHIFTQLGDGEEQNQWYALWGYMPAKYRDWNGETLCRIAAHLDDFCELINGLIKRYTKLIDDAIKSTN